MTTRIEFEKKEDDGRLWIHTMAKITPEQDTSRYPLPMIMHPTKRKAKEQPNYTWQKLGFDQGYPKFEILKGLSFIEGLTLVSFSRYAISIDKARAFPWRKILWQVELILRRAFDGQLEITGAEEFLEAFGEVPYEDAKPGPTGHYVEVGTSDEDEPMPNLPPGYTGPVVAGGYLGVTCPNCGHSLPGDSTITEPA